MPRIFAKKRAFHLRAKLKPARNRPKESYIVRECNNGSIRKRKNKKNLSHDIELEKRLPSSKDFSRLWLSRLIDISRVLPLSRISNIENFFLHERPTYPHRNSKFSSVRDAIVATRSDANSPQRRLTCSFYDSLLCTRKRGLVSRSKIDVLEECIVCRKSSGRKSRRLHATNYSTLMELPER